MLAFGEPHDAPEMTALTPQEADDILVFAIDRAWAAYDAQEHRRTP